MHKYNELNRFESDQLRADIRIEPLKKTPLTLYKNFSTTKLTLLYTSLIRFE